MLNRHLIHLILVALTTSCADFLAAQVGNAEALQAFHAARTAVEQLESVPVSQRSTPAEDQLALALGEAVVASALADLNSLDKGSRPERVEHLRQNLAKLVQQAVVDRRDSISSPVVMTADLTRGYTVFATYSAVSGGAGAPFLTHWIWAFQERNGKFVIVDRAGEDLSDAGLLIEPLPSGRSGEQWFLAWGIVSGANQTPVRARVYAFDGEKFQTLWSPSDLIQARIRRTQDGFELRFVDPVQKYQLSQPPYNRYERYVMTVQGVFLQESHLTDELDFP